MKRVALLIFLLCTFACQKNSVSDQSTLNFIPKDPVLVVKVNDPVAFDSELKNNELIHAIGDAQLFEQLQKKWKSLNIYNTAAEKLLSLNEVGKDNYEWTLIGRSIDTEALDSSKVTPKQFNYEGINGTSYVYDDIENHKVMLDSVTVISTSKLLVENTIRHYKESSPFSKEIKKAFAIADQKKPANIFVKTHLFSKLSNQYLKQPLLSNMNDWFSLDVSMGQDQLLLTGIAQSKDSLDHKLSLFDGIKPQAFELAASIPSNSAQIVRFGYDDFEEFQQNINVYDLSSGTKRDPINSALFGSLNEIAIVSSEKDTLIAAHSINAENTLTEIPKTDQTETFRDVTIYQIDDASFFANAFQPLIDPIKVRFAAQVEDAFFFAASKEALKDCLANVLNGTVLGKQSSYNEFVERLGSAPSLVWLGVNPNFKNKIAEESNAPFRKRLEDLNLKSYPYFALQLTQDNGFAHATLAIAKNKPIGDRGTVTQLASITLDAPVANHPQWVINHRSRQKEVAVQDEENHLYLISNKGKVLWRKELDGKIYGAIQQVDLYKNGRLQLAFVTDNKLHILDRNGKEVAPFPISFENTITQPLALFDYDKNKNYRFLVTTGNRLHMYDRQAKKVSGFTFTRAKDNVIKTPKHFRINNKDYLVIAEESGKLNILDRRGNTRIAVRESIDFSENDLYNYRDRFATTDKNGNLITIDTKGKLTKQGLKLNEDHGIDATSKTLATLSENILEIKNNKVTLDYGLYTKPKIFYINNKICVSVTDLQANHVYLFDSNAKGIPNFPVYGKEAIDLADADNDKRMELVVKGEDDAILIYEVN